MSADRITWRCDLQRMLDVSSETIRRWMRDRKRRREQDAQRLQQGALP